MDRLAGLHESIGLRETLDDSTLTQRNGAILIGMSESAIAETEKLRGHRGRRFIPTHAAIDARIGFATFFAMAFGDEFGIPVPPSTSRSRGADAAKIRGGKRRGMVQGIARMLATGRQWRKCGNGLPDRARFFRVRRRNQADRAEFGRKKDEPLALLRHTVVGGFHDLEANMIFGGLQRGDKSPEDGLFSKARNIFHRHQRGVRPKDQALELGEEIPPAISLGGFALAVQGKWLAGGTAGEEREVGAFPRLGNLLGLQCLNRLKQEASPIVERKRVFASGIHVNAEPDIDAGSLQPPSEASSSAKQIHCTNALHFGSTILKTRTDFALFGRERTSQPCELFNESILNFAKMVEA